MGCLTFQSRDVLDLLVNTGKYTPDISKCREGADGIAKVWCFDVAGKDINDFRDGTLFERFRCEMSLDQEIGLTRFIMFEIDIDDNRLSWCDAHNAYKYAKVFDELYFADLVGIYTIHNTPFWFYKSIKVMNIFNSSAIFVNGLDMFYTGCWSKYLRKVKPYDEDDELDRLKNKFGVNTFNEVIVRLLDNELSYIKKECDY